MKLLCVLLTAIVTFSLAANAQKPGVKQVANRITNSPFKNENATLSFGNARHSSKFLQAWKAYDDNDLDWVGDMFAEDMFATLADETVVKGRLAFLKALKEYRGSFASA